MPHEVLGAGKFLRLVRAESGWEHCERTNCTWAVVIAARTADDAIVLVEQHRPPVEGRTIELPAGLMGDEDLAEEWMDAAARELEEETGFRAHQLEEVARGPVSPGLTTEQIIMVRATGVERVSSGGGVGQESIVVHLVPLDQAERWLETQRRNGLQVDPKIYAGLYFLRAKTEGR
jgi:ADP-ribose pyrophosphatase